MSQEQLKISMDAQRMVNDLVSVSCSLVSPYPVHAMHAIAKHKESKKTLIEYIASLEQKVKELSK